MEEFYEQEKRQLERQRARLLKSYPLWEVLSRFSDTAFRLKLRYQDFIDKPTGINRRIVTLQLTKLTEDWLTICEANILGEDHEPE